MGEDHYGEVVTFCANAGAYFANNASTMPFRKCDNGMADF